MGAWVVERGVGRGVERVSGFWFLWRREGEIIGLGVVSSKCISWFRTARSVY